MPSPCTSKGVPFGVVPFAWNAATGGSYTTHSHTIFTKPSLETQSKVSPSVDANGFWARPYQEAYELAANAASKATLFVELVDPDSPSHSIALYNKSKLSKSSTVRCISVNGWLMFAGMDIRDKSLPIDCFSMDQREKLWFRGCGAGRRSRGAKFSSSISSSFSSSEFSSSSEASETEVWALPERLTSSSLPTGKVPPDSFFSILKLLESTKSCRLTTSAATNKSTSSTFPKSETPPPPNDPPLTPVAKDNTLPYASLSSESLSGSFSEYAELSGALPSNEL
mmetsp:Transcript_2735/g.9577  ORF Transcript_2735/g.9577 Transcript_2735/m.9577 type:complete len:282 (-) Transcript_2735:1705-2550(-)